MSQLNTQRCLSRFFSFVVAATLIAFQLHATQVFADANETASSNLNAKASASLALNRFTTCAITNVGAVFCWGRDNVGYKNVLVPTQVPTLTSGAVALASTDDTNCVLLNTGGVKCWGPNWLGLLGDLTETNSATPVDVYGLTSGVKAISGGYNHMCALLIGGTMKCWGSNNAFQLGIPTMGQTTTGSPTAVPNLTGVTAISAGGYHTCALLDTGTLKCWGNNGAGQLGDESTTDSRSPVDVRLYGTIFVSVTTGHHHTCALTVNNRAYCWGKNYHKQLGLDNSYSNRFPSLVTVTESTVSALAAGDIHTCAVLTTGVVKCWGVTWMGGRLGAGDITNAIAVSAGEGHSCAVLATGAVKCWGDNDYGQLGNGTTTETWSAVQATGLTNNVGVPTTTTTTTTTTLAPTTTSTSTTTTVPTTTSTSSTTTSSSSVPSSVTTTTTTSTPVSAVSPPVTPASTTTTPQSQSAIETIAPSTPVAEPSPMVALSPSTTTTATASVVVPSPTTTSTSSPTRTSTTTTTPTETRTDGITPGDTKSIAIVMANSPSNRIIVFVDGEKTDALITNTDRKVTVSVAGAKIVLSATAPDGTMINVDSDGVLEVQPGSTVSTASTGFAAYSPVETWCYCTPTQLGSETTNGIGATQTAYPLPAAVTTGSHHLVVEGANARKQSITIGFAMRVTNTSVFSRIISNPLAWFFLVIFSLIGLLLPARIRRRSESTT